jgi:hypothetical protein
MMRAITGLLDHIEERKRNAERQAESDPRWLDRVDNWKAHAENIRQLRQALLREADRARGFLEQLTRDRTFIEDILAGEGVAKAKQEMEVALRSLRQLGDSLQEAIKMTEERNKKLSSPSM